MEISYSLNLSRISAINPQRLYLGLEHLKYDSSDTSKLFCIKCLSTPLIEVQSLFNLKINCNCINKKKENFSINEVNNNFIIDLEDSFNNTLKKYEKYFLCEKHNKNFQFFCNICMTDLCQECIKIHDCNEKKDLIVFNIIHYQLFKKIIFLDNAFNEDLLFLEKDIEEELDNELNNNNNVNINYENIKNLKRLISTLIYEYNTSPNMMIIKNINNIYDKLSKEYNLYIKNKDMNVNIEIFSEHDFLEKYNEINRDLIKKIEIPANNFNINILKDTAIINLEILNLKGNNISDISPLSTANLENLKNLNLNSNQIGDNMIKYIYNFRFYKLENLNFGINNFQNYEIFKSIEHFENLKKLNINSNFFRKEIPKEFNIDSIKFNLIEEVDFSNGVFSEENINFMFKIFKFQNLKIIDLTSNNLKTLIFIQNIKNCPLEKLILENNEIEESQLKFLEDFENLKEVNIKDNSIKSIDEVNKLKNIEKINLCGNKINLYPNEEKDDDLINEIDEIFESIIFQ